MRKLKHITFWNVGDVTFHCPGSKEEVDTVVLLTWHAKHYILFLLAFNSVCQLFGEMGSDIARQDICGLNCVKEHLSPTTSVFVGDITTI